MDDIIKVFRTDVTDKFAHSKSEDFEDCRCMSAGVAVVLRERFDRPKSSDYVNTILVRQKVNIGATIFSLVAKPKYWGKPNMDNYDVAFKELEENFQNYC